MSFSKPVEHTHQCKGHTLHDNMSSQTQLEQSPAVPEDGASPSGQALLEPGEGTREHSALCDSAHCGSKSALKNTILKKERERKKLCGEQNIICLGNLSLERHPSAKARFLWAGRFL